ncbi:MAG TPA: c-type cytochrome [Steroidobacteraceae bacterium]|nr:c-type cytochrome [Steroidobacteraceae bacterium]
MQQRAKTFEARLGRAEPPRRWWHSFWLWLTIAIVAAVLVFATHSAAAQTERANALIERALELRGDVSNGESLYKDLCANCHGHEAYGGGEPVTPALAGQLPIYIIKQLVDLAEGDRTEPEMHRVVALKRLSSAQALSDLATYLRRLPPNPRPEVGDGKDLAAGNRYYAGLCAFCHGANGEGNEKHATPSLQHQHYSYLLMQSRRLAVGHRYSVPIEVIEVLEKLPFDQLTAIADYASRLPDRTLTPAGGQPVRNH